MDGFRAGQPALEGIASKLRTGSTSLEGTAAPPPAPEVGACTAAVSAVLALLTDSIGGVVEGLDAVGDAVTRSGAVYGETDGSETNAFTGFGLS